jgi:hypothetical protein
MTAFDCAQTLRELSSRLENVDPKDWLALQGLAADIETVCFDVDRLSGAAKEQQRQDDAEAEREEARQRDELLADLES